MYLNCHSTFSFRYGTLNPEELVDLAADKGYKSLALTDINNTTAAWSFYRACRKKGITPLLGIDFRQGNITSFIGIARSMKGYAELNRHLSMLLAGEGAFLDRPPEFEEAVAIYPSVRATEIDDLRPGEYFGISPREVPSLRTSTLLEDPDKLVILAQFTFINRTGFNTHRLLRAIDSNAVLSNLPVEALALPDEVMWPKEQLEKRFEDYPALLSNTRRLIDRCQLDFVWEAPKSKRVFGASRYEDKLLIERTALEGLERRYGSNPKARKRVLRELEVMEQMDFLAYFLIAWDLVRCAESRGFSHVGRGSGANSLVAYCMGITDVDPIGLNLYFERFMNPHRAVPPDFDLDFSWKHKDEIVNYLFDTHGHEHTALLATYNRFKGRSIIRELGKVFGLPTREIDGLVKRPFDPVHHDHIAEMVFRYGKRIVEFPNHLSVHSGGIMISEEPMQTYTATSLSGKGLPITQFDMNTAEDIGLHKYDILSQRGLGHIREARELVEKREGITVDIHNIGKLQDDRLLNEKLSKGDTVGCFYIESPAMRQLLRKLKCDNFHTLIAASSVIRPGVARSGMMREYLKRHHSGAEDYYPHPKIAEILGETHGIMIYQEDVMRMAHLFAGIDLGDADVLRRAISGKSPARERIPEIRKTFFENCKDQGYEEQLTAEIWRQMEAFSGFSFSKAHSASFAVESYQSLYLKTYHPKEFMVAVMNNFGGFYDLEYYINEARQNGTAVELPDVNESEFHTTLIGDSIYLGFVHLKDLESKTARTIAIERRRSGPYIGLDDFVHRLSISMDQLHILVRIGAFRFLGKTKKELLWEAAKFYGTRFNKRRSAVRTAELFETPAVEYELPVLAHEEVEDAYDEIEILGFPLSNPFNLLAEDIGETLPAKGMKGSAGRSVTMAGYLVCTKDVRGADGKLMKFATFLDPHLRTFDSIHFSHSIARFPFQGKGIYLLHGNVQIDYGVPTMAVSHMKKLPYKADPRALD